jgi:hypothetical protein
MSHAIIRGRNGRRHEVDFGDSAVRVEIYASEETVEIFVEADFETCQKNAGVLLLSTFRASSTAEPLAQQRVAQIRK